MDGGESSPGLSSECIPGDKAGSLKGEERTLVCHPMWRNTDQPLPEHNITPPHTQPYYSYITYIVDDGK